MLSLQTLSAGLSSRALQTPCGQSVVWTHSLGSCFEICLRPPGPQSGGFYPVTQWRLGSHPPTRIGGGVAAFCVDGNTTIKILCWIRLPSLLQSQCCLFPWKSAPWNHSRASKCFKSAVGLFLTYCSVLCIPGFRNSTQLGQFNQTLQK